MSAPKIEAEGAACKHKWVKDMTYTPMGMDIRLVLHCEHCGEVKEKILWHWMS